MDLEVHQPTVDAMKAHYEPQGKEVNEARMRMATLPAGSQASLHPIHHPRPPSFCGNEWVPGAKHHPLFGSTVPRSVSHRIFLWRDADFGLGA